MNSLEKEMERIRIEKEKESIEAWIYSFKKIFFAWLIGCTAFFLALMTQATITLIQERGIPNLNIFWEYLLWYFNWT